MLGTLFRHTGRLNEAHQQLDLLDRHAGGEKWSSEAARERRRLNQLLEQSGQDNNEPAYSGNEQLATDETDVSNAA